ncbi:MAG: DNA translocase FtsK 4TM domain-containing protein [Sumerlaeia bacterium]
MTSKASSETPSFLPRGGSATRYGDLTREALGLMISIAALFLLASLIISQAFWYSYDGLVWIGSIGQAVSQGLRFLLGNYMAFLLPSVMLLFGVALIVGMRLRWCEIRLVAFVFFVMGCAGLIALPGADQPEMRTLTFERAGALGCFLVEWEGLRLVGQFGEIGAGMILSGMVLLGLIFTTQVGFGNLARKLAGPETEEAEWEESSDSVALEPEPKACSRGEEPRDNDSGEEDEDTPRRGLLAKIFGSKPGPDESRSTLLPEEIAGAAEDDSWDDLDQDVLAAARALEEQEEEERLAMLLGTSSTYVPKLDEEEDTADVDTNVEDDDPEFDEPVIIGLDEEDEEDAEEETAEADAPDDDLEIKFTDCSGPLQPAATAAPKAKLGAGLARLFPTRWKDDGQRVGKEADEGEAPGAAPDAEAAEDTPPWDAAAETHEDFLNASEARAFRRIGTGVDPEDLADDAEESDPLFHPEADTRPHGPEGAVHPEFEPSLIERSAGYILPDVTLLADPPVVDARMTREEIIEMSQCLTETLENFGVQGRVVEVKQGPVVTRFEFKPAPGIKVSKISGLEQDIAMNMRALSVRILAPIPGKAAVGIELPNKKRQGVYLKELLNHESFTDADGFLPIALGKTIDGQPYVADLAKAPHLLIAGATGAGKSVCLNTIICSLLYRFSPDKVRLIMVDPKRVELSVYQDIPHLIAPVVCEPKSAASALDWAVEQMEQRYQKLVDYGVRNIAGFNEIAENPDKHAHKLRGKGLVEPMPYMVVIVDELADLMLVAKAEVEESIQRLAQMARAVGIHLILATQRPSVNVITGIIKANFPSRIAFQVSQKVDSRTILDGNGAENLLGRGDMLFAPGGAGKPIRVQGAFLSDDEVERIADHCRAQMGAAYDIDEFEPKLSEKEMKELAKMMGTEVSSMEDLEAQDRVVRGTNHTMGKVVEGMFTPHEGGSARAGDDEIDEALVRAAARLILENRKASVSLIQRRLKVGFARAGRLMDMLEEMGVVGPFQGSKPRDLIVDPEAALEELDRMEGEVG